MRLKYWHVVAWELIAVLLIYLWFYGVRGPHIWEFYPFNGAEQPP